MWAIHCDMQHREDKIPHVRQKDQAMSYSADRLSCTSTITRQISSNRLTQQIQYKKLRNCRKKVSNKPLQNTALAATDKLWIFCTYKRQTSKTLALEINGKAP